MTSEDDPHGLLAIARFWGDAYHLSHDPVASPGEPYTAARKDGQATLRAATAAQLLDAIKDDSRLRLFGDLG